MKRINALIVVILVLITSCKKDKQLINDVATAPLKLTSKQMSSRPLNPGDPNLDVNWDWTQSNWNVYFNNPNGTIGFVPTLNPFIDGAQTIYGNVNSSKADMYPAAGWMLVSRDFGTPNGANAYPFVLLYNKYKGILRVCILRTYDVLSSYQQITLSFAPNVSYPNTFVYSSTVPPYPITGGGVNTKSPDYKQTAITFAGVNHWMIADFDVKGYSSSIDDNTSFNISMSEISQSDITLSGTILLDGSAQPQAAGPSQLSHVKNVYNYYSSTVSGISKVLKIPEKDVQDRLTGGATTLVKAFVGLLTGFSGGNSGTPYSLKIKGTTSQTGTIKLTSPKTSFSVYLKPKTSSVAYKALQSIPWGVFFLNKANAHVEYQQLYTWVTDEYGYPGEVWDGYQKTVYLPQNFLANSLSINPAIAGEVKSIEVSYGGGWLTSTQNDAVPRQIYTSKNSEETTLPLMITFKNGVVIYELIAF